MEDYFLSIDEFDGRIYRVPKQSLVLEIRPPLRIEAHKWTNVFVDSRRDSTCFVNAETIGWISGVAGPCAVFKSKIDGQYLYANSIDVFGADSAVGQRFLWPLSHHQHYCSWIRFCEFRFPSTEELQPIKDKFQVLEQRPSPSRIAGAVCLEDPGASMSELERLFFLQSITGRFIFRDARESIDSFVRHTRKRKETFPERVRFHSTVNHQKQLQRKEYCENLKTKANDPKLYEQVKKRALYGLAFLESLKTPPAIKVSNSNGINLNSIGCDLFDFIIENVVSNILKTQNSIESAVAFRSLLLVDKHFSKTARSTANRLILDAKNSLSDFVLTGQTEYERVERLPWIMYRRFSCSPYLLLRVNSNVEYFKQRISCKLEPSISVARAHARGASSPCMGVSSATNGYQMKSSQSFEFSNPTAGTLPMRILQLYNIANGE